MAKVSAGAAYQRLTVPETEIGANSRAFGAISAANRRHSQGLNAQEKARKEQKRKEDEERYALDPDKYNITDAGYSDLNSANIDFASQLVDREAEYMMKAREANAAGNRTEAEQWRNKALMNRNLFKNDQETMAKHKEVYDMFIEDSLDGKVSGYSKGFKNFYDAAMTGGKMLKTVNDRNEIVYMTEIEDENGNKLKQVVPENELKSNKWKYYLKQDIPSDVTTMAGNLGSIKRKDVNGYITTETTQWDDGKPNGIHTQAALEAINGKLGDVGYMSDMVDQFDLYDEFGIDKNNPQVNRKYTKEEKDVVANKLLAMVRAAYNETFSDTFNSSKYATDAANARAKNKKEDPDGLSNLHYDADRFVNGDYTGLLGRHENEYEEEINIREVIPSPDGNYVVAVTDAGQRIEIPNTKRGFLEFKIRNKPEYKGLTPEKVLQTDPEAYRSNTTAGSKISAVASDLFNEEGKPKVDDEKILKRLNETFKIEGEDNFTWSGNSLTINGKSVDTSSRQAFETTLQQALEPNKQKINW